MTIPSQSFLSEEGCHWFDVGFSPDVFIVDVVLLGPISAFSSQWYFIGVNISERKSGTERTKKRKKRELICFPTARGRNGVHRL